MRSSLHPSLQFEIEARSSLNREDAAFRARYMTARGRDVDSIKFQHERGMSRQRLVGIYGAAAVDFALGTGEQV